MILHCVIRVNKAFLPSRNVLSSSLERIKAKKTKLGKQAHKHEMQKMTEVGPHILAKTENQCVNKV